MMPAAVAGARCRKAAQPELVESCSRRQTIGRHRQWQCPPADLTAQPLSPAETIADCAYSLSPLPGGIFDPKESVGADFRRQLRSKYAHGGGCAISAFSLWPIPRPIAPAGGFRAIATR